MTIKQIFNWLIGVPIAIVAIAFAIANRQWVTISFDPFNRTLPFATVDMPLWALFFCGVFAGIFAGWLVAWIAQGRYRKALRETRIELVRTQQLHEREKRDLQSTAVANRQDS